MLYDNGWYRIIGVSNNGVKKSHYFFNDKPIHSLKHGIFKEEVDCSRRYLFESKKCKTCIIILDSYSNLENRPT